MRVVGVKDLMTLACQAEGREVIGEGGEERAGLDSARRRRFPFFCFVVFFGFFSGQNRVR